MPGRSVAAGALLGTFAGDALGRPWEGGPPLIGRDGAQRVEQSLAAAELAYTDDTQLALALAEHLLEHPDVEPEAWRETILAHAEPHRGYGAGMRRLLRLWERGVGTDEAATAVFAEGSFGNGAAMRVAPVGVRWRHDRLRRESAARRQARVSHVHPLGVAGAALQADAVALAARRGRFGIGEIEELAGRGWPDELAAELQRAVEAVAAWGDTPRPGLADVALGRGVTAHRSVPAALWCAAVGGEIEQAVGLALGLGGDADTIAAMAGAVTGAADPDAIPPAWLRRLEDGFRGRSYAEELAARLEAACDPGPVAAVDLRGVTVRQGGNPLLEGVDWRLDSGEHAVVLGPNGAGKTTLLRVLSGYRHPTGGTAAILGRQLGATDVRSLRRQIGFVSDGLGDLLHRRASAVELVLAAGRGATRPVDGRPSAEQRRGAVRVLDQVGAGGLADRRCVTLSQGEWQRVQIACALAGEPDLLLLDEPMVGLDLGARESLLADLDGLLAQGLPGVILVTHHLEEIPAGITHGLLLRGGRIVAAGPIDEVVTDELVSATFGVAVEVMRRQGRWVARAAG